MCVVHAFGCDHCMAHIKPMIWWSVIAFTNSGHLRTPRYQKWNGQNKNRKERKQKPKKKKKKIRKNYETVTPIRRVMVAKVPRLARFICLHTSILFTSICLCARAHLFVLRVYYIALGVCALCVCMLATCERTWFVLEFILWSHLYRRYACVFRTNLRSVARRYRFCIMK